MGCDTIGRLICSIGGEIDSIVGSGEGTLCAGKSESQESEFSGIEHCPYMSASKE